jgi:DNA-nicking Smr family endonuclease
VAKLSELRALVDAARARAATTAPAGERRGPSMDANTPARPRQAVSAPAAVAAMSRRHVAASKHAAADIDVTQAFADVQRLAPRNRAASTRPQPPAIPAMRIEDEQDALAMSKYGAEPSPHAWDIGQELEAEQTFVRSGLGTDVLVKLRRGHWSVQGVIDLHGMTSDEAHDALADFLLDARSHGFRCVRVIHGKGLSSPNREPVLKGKVRRWLSQWDDVLAYCEAARHAGGGGAVHVLLRGR